MEIFLLKPFVVGKFNLFPGLKGLIKALSHALLYAQGVVMEVQLRHLKTLVLVVIKKYVIFVYCKTLAM